MVTMQIWTNRLLKEFDGIESRLPSGFSLSSHTMDAESGVCKAVFEAILIAPPESSLAPEKDGEAPAAGAASDVATVDGQAAKEDGGQKDTEGKVDGDAQQSLGDGDGPSETETADGSKHPVPLAFQIEMDLGLDTRYPFDSPVIRIVEGSEVIPTDLISGDVILLPDSDSWTPSNTIIATLQDISDMVIHAREAGLPTGEGDDTQALERGTLRPGSLVPIEALGGSLYPCTPPPTPLFSGSIMSPLARRPLDRYMGVTDRQVLELEAHRTRMNQTVVISAIDLRTLSKLKFRRGASVTLVLRGGENKEFLTPQSHECVTTVTERLHKMGIAGHQTTAGAEKQVDRAKSIMASLQRKERQLDTEPSLDLVQESMDLFRQAAELFSAAEDARHEQVVGHMHAFLQRPNVIAVLEGKMPPPSAQISLDSDAADVGTPEEGPADGSVPRGEVLERSPPPPGSRESDDDDDGVAQEESSVKEGSQSMDELQKMLEDSTSTEATTDRSIASDNKDFDTTISKKDPAGKSVGSAESRKTPTKQANNTTATGTTPSKKTPVSSGSKKSKPQQATGNSGKVSGVAGSGARSSAAKSSPTESSSNSKETSDVRTGGSGSRGRGRSRGAKGGGGRGSMGARTAGEAR